MSKTDQYEDDVFLSQVIKVLWKRKGLIIIGTIAVTAVAIILALVLPKTYRSEAVISLDKELPIPRYNDYSNIFKNDDFFKKFLDFRKNDNGWQISPEYIEDNVKPIYGYDKNLRVNSAANFVLGLKITGTAAAPGKAMEKALLLGNYVRSTILNSQIGDYISMMRKDKKISLIENEQAISRMEFEIKNLKEKDSLITNQLLKIPGIPNKTEREVVNVDQKTERYLSPQQQLIAVKVAIKDNEIMIENLQRENKINQILLDFFDKISNYIDDKKDFLVKENLLANLINEKEKYFPGKVENETREAFYIISIEFSNFEKLQDVVYQFISGPTLPKKAFKPNKKLIVFFSFVLAFLFFIFMAVAVEWWTKNKDSISRSNGS